MALLSDLVRKCAELGIDSEKSLAVFARRLREAGRLSQAGRGRGAAHMNYVDAARFLIACAATDHPERAAECELAFSNTVFSSGFTTQDDPLPLSAEAAPSLDIALAKMLEASATGVFHAEGAMLHPIMRLTVQRGGVQAKLKTPSGEYIYCHPALEAVVRQPDAQAQKPWLEKLEAETRIFRTGKNLVAEFDSATLRKVAELIAGKTGK
ncbi:hypothetical protein BSY18_632 [Blastomonas sp. RAC04]|uniref:hypothetical protein n=1 Tax=Blastomonas sp. RAC04 TaxID=1842535 RepID=UPI00083D4051|nr:hypothetical protein [Blastomonas sp. RAC04]AOG00234.1 hypothetical protein BSY18_632 [Blastomonas sp. RAC04]